MTQDDGSSIEATPQEAAMRWHARLNSGDAVEADFDAFADWLEADPAHFTAYADVDAFDADLSSALAGSPGALSQIEAELAAPPVDLHANRQSGVSKIIRPMAFAMAACAALAVATVVWSPPPAGDSESVVLMADGGGVLEQVLEDGTAIQFTPGAQAKFDMDAGARQINAFSGLGYFSVATDIARPFEITFDGGRIQVLGTQFEAAVFDGARRVSVKEGRVLVEDQDGRQFRLQAGEMYVWTAQQPSGVVESVDQASIAQWRDGSIVFSETPLDDVFEQLNRIYGPGAFSSRDEAVSKLTFSGVLPIQDMDETARLLADLLILDLAVTDQGALFSAR
ncbi:MAG: FecR domain-containing protein [Pseudomonadota bacterium]